MKGPAILNRPRLHVGEAEEYRKATWLELFYDLVYIATIIQLGNRLSHDVSADGFLGFVILFIPIWWSWVGSTFYSNRFDSDDWLHRVMVFLKIAFVSLMAINIFDAFDDTSAQFALGYAGVRFVLVGMYLRAYYFVKAARGLALRYALGFGLAAMFWLISVFVPSPWRFVLWAIGLTIDFAIPLMPTIRRLQEELPPSPHHLPERFGLFTIIVFGEAFIKVIGGLTGHIVPIEAVFFDLPALAIAASLWWIYFDNVAETRVVWEGIQSHLWLYTHLPLQLSLTSFAIGVLKLVTLESGSPVPPSYRWLISGSVALALLSLGLIEKTTVGREPTPKWKSELALRILSAIFIVLLALVGHRIETWLMLVLIAAICVLQVAVDLYWRHKLHPGDTMPQI